MLDMLICCCAQQPTLQVAIFVFVAAAAAVVVVSNHDSVRLLSLKHGRKGANSLVDKKSCFQINLLLCLREHRGWLPRLCLLSRRTCFSIWLLERHTQVAIPDSIMSLPSICSVSQSFESAYAVSYDLLWEASIIHYRKKKPQKN